MAKMLEYRTGRAAYLAVFTVGIAAMKIFILNPAVDYYGPALVQYIKPAIGL